MTRCQTCGREEIIELLDAKPSPDVPKEGWERDLECIVCYGPDWMPRAMGDLKHSINPELRPLYAEFEAIHA